MYLLTERKKLKKQSYLISCHSLGKRFSHWSLKLKFSSEKTFLVQYKTIWTGPKQFGLVQNRFGPKEGQGIGLSMYFTL